MEFDFTQFCRNLIKVLVGERIEQSIKRKADWHLGEQSHQELMIQEVDSDLLEPQKIC